MLIYKEELIIFLRFFLIGLFILLCIFFSCSDESKSLDETTGTVTDIDGNTYQTVKIGDQWWMAENLKVTHYRNGNAIPNVTDDSEWLNLKTGAWCSYNNDDSNVEIYGLLYNWYAVVDSRNLAPEGWHVPTDEEWKELEMYLGMSQTEADNIGRRGTDEGGKLKARGTDFWNSPNTGATNESGFSALPGSIRFVFFDILGINGMWWTSTEYSDRNVWHRMLNSDYSDINRYWSNKEFGLSVRCVRD